MPSEIRPSYQNKLTDLELKIISYIKFGYFYYKPLGYKEVKINSYLLKESEAKIEFIIETKHGGSFPFEVNIKSIDGFFNNLITHKPREINISLEQKSQSEIFNKVKVGFTKDYLRFKFSKKNSQIKDISYIKDTFNRFGNIIPVIVFKRVDGNYQILDGKKRFNYLMKEQEDIFYIDITSLINKNIILNEQFVINADIIINKKTLKESWDDLCRYYYPSYKMLDLFMKENSVEEKINKFHFITILEPNIEKILKGEAVFELNKIQGIWKEIVDYFNEDKNSNSTEFGLLEFKKGIYSYLQMCSKYYIIELPKEEIKKSCYWFTPNIISLIANPNNPEDISELKIVGNYYEINFIQNNKLFFKEELIKEEGTFHNIGGRLIINVDNIGSFLKENDILFKAILQSLISIDLDEILKDVLDERKEFIENDFNEVIEKSNKDYMLAYILNQYNLNAEQMDKIIGIVYDKEDKDKTTIDNFDNI